MSHTDDLFHEEPLPEGEEQAPPLTRTMGIVRWAILGAMTLFAVAMILGFFGLAPWTSSSSASTQFHCPMHPTYITSQPGDCPICGMSLVPIDAKIDADSAIAAEHGGEMGKVSVAKPGQYYCPMCTEVASDTEGKCPTCGMFLEKFEPGMKFTCEMHPEVVTDHSGDCPKCGMDLMPLDTTSHPAGHTMTDESSVPGLVPVTLEPQRLQLIGLRTEKVAKSELSNSRRLLGYVVPDETRTHNLSVRISGWVRELAANQTGQLIHKGDKLLTIYSQDLLQAAQEYRLARSSNMAGSVDQQRIITAARNRMLNLGLTEQEITSLESDDSDPSVISLFSPVSGIILSKNVNAGQFVSPSENLLSIAALATVWVLADVFESDLAEIRSGQAARMTTTAYPERRFDGTVSFIYPTVSPETRTAKVRISFANPDLALKPGMYAEVNLISASSSALTISREALLDGGEVAYVFVVTSGNHFTPRKVTVGRRDNDRIEILSGLAEHELVVTSANFLIDSESRLKAAISGMGGSAQNEHQGHGK